MLLHLTVGKDYELMKSFKLTRGKGAIFRETHQFTNQMIESKLNETPPFFLFNLMSVTSLWSGFR